MAAAAPNAITAVIFDFDGVLADTERLHLGAFREVFAERGWALDEGAYFERYLGCDDRGLVVAYAEDERLAIGDADVRTLVREKTRAFSRHLVSRDILYPGAKACVEQFVGRFALAIASGALHEEIEAILRTGGILSFFPVIIAADDVRTTKPSPEPYLTAAARLGVAPSSCVAVEDSSAGLAAAKAAGMRAVGITTTSPRRSLGVADRIIEHLHELSPELIASLG